MKTTSILSAAAGLLAVGAISTHAPAAATAPGPATFSALAQQFSDAMLQQDLTKATACLAKNVRMLANVSPVVSGRDSTSTYWLKRSFSSTSNLKFTNVQMSSDATTGCATGYYTYDIKPMASLPQGGSGRGSFMELARKEGGVWQITHIHLAEEPVKAK